MLDFFKERYPYSFSQTEILKKMIDFQYADDDLMPICLKGKYWELIKEDIWEEIEKLKP